MSQNLLASKKKKVPKRKSTPVPSSTPTSGTKTASPTIVAEDTDDADASQKVKKHFYFTILKKFWQKMCTFVFKVAAPGIKQCKKFDHAGGFRSRNVQIEICR